MMCSTIQVLLGIHDVQWQSVLESESLGVVLVLAHSRSGVRILQ